MKTNKHFLQHDESVLKEARIILIYDLDLVLLAKVELDHINKEVEYSWYAIGDEKDSQNREQFYKESKNSRLGIIASWIDEPRTGMLIINGKFKDWKDKLWN